MSEGVPGSDWALNQVLRRVFILGTGLLGTSIGLALRAGGFTGSIVGWDKDSSQSETAFRLCAVEAVATDPLQAAEESQLIVLATPVYSILDWMERLAPVLDSSQVLTDVGSTKAVIYEAGQRLYNRPGQACFLAGHPMAGKELGGAAHAEAGLFCGAAWIFAQEKRMGAPPEDRTSPQADGIAIDWTLWIREFGCRLIFMEPTRHDELLAWVSHLPQFLSTALTAMIEHEVGAAPELNSIGGRALREMTRLGSSPYSMWRDVALTNTDAVAKAIYSLEQRLAHLRENLRTPELRDEFERANRFRKS